MTSLIAQLVKELNSKLTKSEISDILHETMTELIDSGRFNADVEHGIRIMAKEFIGRVN